MTTGQVRTDAENRRLLDSLLPAYEKLKTDRIRTGADVERLEIELAAAEKAAIATFGTADTTELEAMLHEAREKNSQTVDQFAEIVRGAQERIARLNNGQAA